MASTLYGHLNHRLKKQIHHIVILFYLLIDPYSDSMEVYLNYFIIFMILLGQFSAPLFRSKYSTVFCYRTKIIVLLNVFFWLYMYFLPNSIQNNHKQTFDISIDPSIDPTYPSINSIAVYTPIDTSTDAIDATLVITRPDNRLRVGRTGNCGKMRGSSCREAHPKWSCGPQGEGEGEGVGRKQLQLDLRLIHNTCHCVSESPQTWPVYRGLT